MPNAQSNPGFIRGQVPSAAQWNSYFTSKLDALVNSVLRVSGPATLIGTVAKCVVDTSAGNVIITYPPNLGTSGSIENCVRFVKKSATPNTNTVEISPDGSSSPGVHPMLVNENDIGGAGWLDIYVNGTLFTEIVGVP